jgi:cytoskeletal protein CcmA (bactofilin family)
MNDRHIHRNDGRICHSGRQGAALLVVLFIVMVITIVSLGFLSRSDVELACGQNMILRAQMDYLVESGLEHARGLILNPQDVVSEYFTGATGQQLVAGSDDYYDLEVVRDDSVPTNRCNYIIDCNSYRLRNGEKIGRSSIRAELRLDPCIAYWAGSSTVVSGQITINGDVYCNGNLTNNGSIGGDVFASGTITGANIEGQKNELVAQAPVDWPGLVSSDFGPTYYIGSTSYLAEIVDVNVHPMGSFNPSAGNPAGIRYCNGDLELNGQLDIKGMLVVNGTLKVNECGEGGQKITAVKNFPALLVSGEVVIENGATLLINGLAQIGQRIVINAGVVNANIGVIGGLFITNGGIDGITSSFVYVDVTAAPAIASIQTWPAAGIARRWGPTAGTFFRSIERK